MGWDYFRLERRSLGDGARMEGRRASVRTNRDYQVREREREGERGSGRMSLILESENRYGDGPLTLIDPD